MTQVWVPEKSDNFPQIDNMHLDDIGTAAAQERLDNAVMRKFNVQKPYILYSRHHFMKTMDWLRRDGHKRRVSNHRRLDELRRQRTLQYHLLVSK
jgi:hypothetical protein